MLKSKTAPPAGRRHAPGGCGVRRRCRYSGSTIAESTSQIAKSRQPWLASFRGGSSVPCGAPNLRSPLPLCRHAHATTFMKPAMCRWSASVHRCRTRSPVRRDEALQGYEPEPGDVKENLATLCGDFSVQGPHCTGSRWRCCPPAHVDPEGRDGEGVPHAVAGFEL